VNMKESSLLRGGEGKKKRKKKQIAEKKIVPIPCRNERGEESRTPLCRRPGQPVGKTSRRKEKGKWRFMCLQRGKKQRKNRLVGHDESRLRKKKKELGERRAPGLASAPGGRKKKDAFSAIGKKSAQGAAHPHVVHYLRGRERREPAIARSPGPGKRVGEKRGPPQPFDISRKKKGEKTGWAIPRPVRSASGEETDSRKSPAIAGRAAHDRKKEPPRVLTNLICGPKRGKKLSKEKKGRARFS